MNKKRALLALLMASFMTWGIANAVPSGPFGYDLQKDIHRTEEKKEEKPADTANATPDTPPRPTSAKPFYSFVPIKDLYTDSIDNTVFYANPTINSAIGKYKKGNYTGCLQELYSYIKKYPNDAYAYYYMGMAYTKIGENKVAAKCYQKTINCNAKGKLLEQALKGRDCLTGGVYCHSLDLDSSFSDPLDQFINAPYTGNGFSPALQEQYKKDQLKNIQRTINRKENLNNKDLNKIDKFDNSKTKSQTFIGEKLAMSASINAEPTNTEVLEAIDVLKRAGLNISTGTLETDNNTTSQTVTNTNSTANIMPNQELMQLNMMLGNNNSNNDSMMNMIPYMMNAENNGQKVDPQVIQAMMVNSMMSGLSNMNSNDDK